MLLFACGAFSLAGFPLDDFWHRLFGQDVTLWGPTHLMLIGGAAMTLVGRSVLLVEGARVAREHRGGGSKARAPVALRFQRGALVGRLPDRALHVPGRVRLRRPAVPLLFGPILVMLAASVALVAARLWAGPGGALLAVALFVAVRGGRVGAGRPGVR